MSNFNIYWNELDGEKKRERKLIRIDNVINRF